MQATDNHKLSSGDITEIIYAYTRHWKWFLISIAFCLIVAGVIIFTSQREYTTSLSILLKEDSGKSPNSQSLMNLEALGVMSTTNNIDNEIAILSSPDLIQQVVDTLNLQVSYFVKKGLRTVEIYKSKPFSVYYKNVNETPFDYIDLYFEKKNDSYELKGSYYKDTGDEVTIKQNNLTFPSLVVLPEGLGILDIKDINPDSPYNICHVRIVNPLQATSSLASGISVISTSKNSTVLKVEIQIGNTEKGAVILRELVRQYNEMNIRENNELAYNTSVFINDRLKEISNELSDVEREVVDYKQRNRITDLDAEAQLFVQQTGSNEQKLIEVETQLNILSLIENFINDPVHKYALIPNLEVTDAGLAQIIAVYNAKLLANEQLIRNTGDANPARKRVLEDIDNTRLNIASSLNNVKSTFQVVKRGLQKQSQSTQSRIQAVPQQQIGLLEKVRLQQVKEALFLFLMQKREETAISIASTANKARIIVSPKLQASQTAPMPMRVLSIALVLGILVPFGVIYVMELLKTKISNQSELEKLTDINIVGQICRNSSDDYVVVQKHDVTPISEMFRSIRNNINFIFKQEYNKTILVTSTTSGEGKTFFSLNLALSYAILDKKVLLIGADIRNPRLKTYLNLDGRKGLTDYLISSSDNLEEYINPSGRNDNLDVLISGTIPPNPNELLTSSRLSKLLNELKSKYDIIILDTAPVGLVSDTYLIEKYADLILYVVRENVTLKSSVEFINKQKDDGSLHNMYLILNDTNLNNQYGYRYGYGKGYGYGKK